jgi:predicted nucleotidyltransferase
MNETQSLIREFLVRKIPDLEVLYLFGSQARGDARPESDYDIAFLAPGKLPPEEIWETAASLGNELRTDVQLVELRTATDVMKSKVIGEGIVLYEKSEFVRQTFEMYALSDYCRLNEARRFIIEDFYREKKDGS